MSNLTTARRVVKLTMASRSSRRKARKKQQRHKSSGAKTLDVHARVVLDSVSSIQEMLGSFAKSDDPTSEIEDAFEHAITQFVDRVRAFDPIRLIEVSRLAYLPWAPVGEAAVAPDAVAAHVELLALIALAARQDSDGSGVVQGSERRPDFASSGGQAMSHFVSEAKDEVENLLRLSQLRAAASADRTDKLAMIAALLRGSEVWVRNTSYPEMVRGTVLDLFDSNPTVHAALTSELGFTAIDAIAALEACHDLQQDKMNDRMRVMFESVSAARASVKDGALDPDVRDATRAT